MLQIRRKIFSSNLCWTFPKNSRNNVGNDIVPFEDRCGEEEIYAWNRQFPEVASFALPRAYNYNIISALMAYLLIAAIITRRGFAKRRRRWRTANVGWRRTDRGMHPPCVIRRRVHNRVSEIGCSVYFAGGGITTLTVGVSGAYGGRTGDSGCFD